MSKPAFQLEQRCDENNVFSGAKLTALEKLELLAHDFHEISSKYSKSFYIILFYKPSYFLLEGVGEEARRLKICDSCEEQDILERNSGSKLPILLNCGRVAHNLIGRALLFFPPHFFFLTNYSSFVFSNLPSDEALF